MTRPHPELLRWDNWTPSTRTPWGGRVIPDRIKAGLPVAETLRVGAVGESWELSVDPSFPSRLARDGRLLSELLAEDPQRWLGRDAALRSTSMLVKLLDAEENLSVQVHPEDDADWLGPTESGKPEAWVVLDRVPGAGIWLGLADGIDRDAMARKLVAHDDIRDTLNFVPVEPGDTFIIEAGTVHAVGAGVTLLEPQLVRPGKSGITYRFWDWGRRYDAAGRLDPHGELRPLHVEQSLRTARWDGLYGADFVASCRMTPQVLIDGAVRHEHVLRLHELVLQRVSGRGELKLLGPGTLAALIVVRGRASVGDVAAVGGQTLVIPAALDAWDLLVDGDAFVVHT